MGNVICALGRFASSLRDKHVEVTAVRCSCFSGKVVLMNVRDDRQKKWASKTVAAPSK